jgi:hypothetical protein
MVKDATHAERLHDGELGRNAESKESDSVSTSQWSETAGPNAYEQMAEHECDHLKFSLSAAG